MAVLNGHTYAGGFILAMCHDFRVMHDGKSRLCLSEANFGGAMSIGYSEILQSKMGQDVYNKL